MKTRILQAADTLFCRSGLRAVSIDDICRFLGIAKKTLYLFYDNKDALVEEFVDASFEKLYHTLEHGPTGADAIQRLKRVRWLPHESLAHILPGFGIRFKTLPQYHLPDLYQ
jgi:AcrR family transcriptional regulator